MELKVFRVREGAKLPNRAHPDDAGMDLFHCPVGEATLNVPPHGSVVLPTGLKISVPKGFMLEVKNKSSIAVKKQFLVGACVVDSGYDGEIFVNLHNVSKEWKEVLPGQKIAQAVLVPVSLPTLVEIDEDRIYDTETSRGSGALGSTGEY